MSALQPLALDTTAMNEPTLNSMAASGPGPEPTDKPSNSIQTLPIEFTGTGSEYFRIWIVNLLLILVTLSLYTPWARARKLRYFHGNTLVDGHPLAFHGDPKKMFRGYLLVGAMALAYSVAGQFSPAAGFIALLVVALISPALLKSSMQFRLANTSWRGLNFRFTGSLLGSYRVMLPLYVFSAFVLGLWVPFIDPKRYQSAPTWFIGATVAVAPLILLMVPWCWWRLKKYQHDHYAYAGLETRFKAKIGSFFWVLLVAVGGVLVSMAVLGALTFSGTRELPLLGVFVLYVVLVSYVSSRVQNLVWSKTGNREFRFQSDLTFRSALKLTFKNWLLIGLTLGLYWPFAAVAMARLKLQAVAVLTRVDPQALIYRAKTHEGEAAGDAAGDLFGVDIGL